MVYATYKNCDLGDSLWHCFTHISGLESKLPRFVGIPWLVAKIAL